MTAMQNMLNICYEEAESICMRFNIMKCQWLRCGKRFHTSCAPLTIHGEVVSSVEEMKYLGVYLMAGRQFSCTYNKAKLSFYRAFNVLFSKSKFSNSELVSVYLLKAYCLPLLRYANEATIPSKRNVQIFDNLIDNAVRKIFNIRDAMLCYVMLC